MNVSIRLNLPKEHNKLVIRYNTFEKVSYDKYLIASLLSETRDKIKAEQLINSLTGNGSLNHHFNKLYEEVSELPDQEILSVLNNSLYPVQRIEEFRFIYIPMLDISIYNRNIFDGNLKDDVNLPMSLVEEGGTYISHSYNEPEVKVKADNYVVSLSDELIKIKMNDKDYSIDQLDFQSIIIKEEIYLGNYQGKIFNEMIGNGWIQLTKSTINNILDSRFFYYYNGNHISINNDSAKVTSIANRWGIYWVNETIYRYQDSSSKAICEMSAKVLMDTGKINEIKTKTLALIIKNVKRDLQQEVINYILSIRGDKELALNGLFLIEKGYIEGWSIKSLIRLYEFHETNRQLLSLYKLSSKLEYTTDDLIKIAKIDNTILNKIHKEQVNKYYNDASQIQENINKKIGEIVSSKIRDNIGKMLSTKEAKKLRKFINDHIAHPKSNNDKTLSQLIDYEIFFNEQYENYKVVLEQWNNFKTNK